MTLEPPSGAVPGWKMAGAVRSFNGDNLYQLIDGEADAVKQYAFSQMADARYTPGGRGNQSIIIDIYDMTDPLDAFGLFSQDRQGGRPLAVGAGGSRTTDGTGISFWKGRYLVRIAATSRSPVFLAAMPRFARVVAARIPGSGSLPSLFSALPPGRQANSEKYVRANAEARAYLSNAVTARYPGAGPSAELFIAQYASPAAASAAYAKYLTAERRNRGLVLLHGVGSAGFSVMDPFQKGVTVAQKGRFVVGMVRAASTAAAQGLVRQAVARLH